MNTQEELNASEVLNASEKRVFDSFQDAKAYLKNTSNLNQKYYKRKDKLIGSHNSSQQENNSEKPLT